jgi:hypothetical protein
MPNGNERSARLTGLARFDAAAPAVAGAGTRPVLIHAVTSDPSAAGDPPAPPPVRMGAASLAVLAAGGAPRFAGAAAPIAARDWAVPLLDPDLARAIDQFRTPDAGQPRGALHLPTMISPTAAPTDQTPFEDPDDSSKHYWLGGGFQVATRIDGTSQAKWVELRPGDGGGFALEAHLSAQSSGPPPSGALPVPGTVPTRCFLRATVQGMVREWDFDEVAVTGAVWRLLLKLDGDDALAQRDAVYRAMTESPDAKLVVRRSLTLAFLASPLPPRFPLWTRASTMTVDPQPFRPGIDRIDPPPAPTPAPPLYRAALTAVDSSVGFVFSKDLDKVVFAKLTDVGTTASGWNRLPVLWQPEADKPGRWHSYYQDRSEPRAVYFLPDEFRISRRPESPHRPWLNLTVLEGATKLSLGYVAVPVWDASRVAAAVPELKKQGAPADLPAPQLFAAGNAGLRLKLPKGDPSGGPGFVDQPGASVLTDSAINGNVTLSVDDFKGVFDALVDDDSDLLSGMVTVKVDDDSTSIPFTARANRFTGSLFDVETAPDSGSGGIRVTARNAIESPVHVAALPVTLLRAGQPVATQVQSTAPALPATIDASPDGNGGTIEVVATAQDGPTGDAEARCDLSQVQVRPDGDALLATILDSTVAAHATRDVNVHVLAAAFNPPAPPAGGGAAPPALLAVVVEFDTGPTANFVKGTSSDGSPFLTQKVTLQLPLKDFLLGHLTGAASQYRYRLNVITEAGARPPGDWQAYALPDLYVTLTGNG